MKSASETPVALLGSLLLHPGLFLEISSTVTPEMFPADLIQAARYIWSKEAAGTGYDIASVADVAGWDRSRKNEILASANPAIIAEHAAIMRDAYLSAREREILEQTAGELASGADYFEVTSRMEMMRERLRSMLPERRNNRGELINRALDGIARAMAKDGLSGLTTGWGDLDAFIGGWQAGDLVIIGGRPGMGKTTVLMHHARQVARAGTPVAILSLEMSAVQLVTKWIGEAAGITAGHLRNGAVNAKEWDLIQQQAADLYDLPVHFVDAQSLTPTLGGIRDTVRQLVEREGVGFVLLDYLQLVQGTDSRQNRNTQIEEISRGLKRLAQLHELPVVALSQLSRAVETRGGSRRPQMADLRDSGSVEQDADIIVMLYRPEYYQIIEDEEGRSLAGVLEYMMLKDRIGGEPRTFRRHWWSAQYHEGRRAENNDIPVPQAAGPMPRANNNEDIPF